MACATTVVVGADRPPSPHLGNFRAVFDALLRLQTDTDGQNLELERHPALKDKAREKARAKSRTKTELLNLPTSRTAASRSAHMAEAAHSFYEDVFKEPRVGVLRISAQKADEVSLSQAWGSVPGADRYSVLDSPTNSSERTSSSTLTNSPRCSTTITTPPGSHGKATATSPPAALFDKSPSVGIPNGSRPTHLSLSPRHPKAQVSLFASPAGSAPVASRAKHVEYRAVAAVSNAGSLKTPQVVARSHADVGLSETALPVSSYEPVPWSEPRFRHNPAFMRHFKGVMLYEFIGGRSEGRIDPLYLSSKQDKEKVLRMKLSPTLRKDEAMKGTLPAASKPIHVFIDLSNITIGFYDFLKKRSGLPLNKRMAPGFSFQHLSIVLERGRLAGKKVVAGSLVSTYHRKWPQYMQEASDLGYEMNILQRVPKSPTRKSVRGGNGEAEWTTSGADSSGEETLVGQLKQGEQGVDELLHLKMLQSALDSEPGTVVLATGDAAEAEYSDGFKKNVERLLQNGWNVEIIGWSKGISSAWRDHAFTKRWGDRVRLIELDPFAEELFALWFGSGGY